MPEFHFTLSTCHLYGIVDLGYVKPETAAIVEMTRRLIEGGIDILQLRAKGHNITNIVNWGRAIHALTQPTGVPLVINDHPHAAAEIGSEGVHVGQEDDAVAKARDVVGERCFVGKSTHSLTQAVAAQEEGADYIGFGPLYATGTKPNYSPIGLQDVAAVHHLVQVPIFCIGGVNAERIQDVLQAGAKRVVVVSALLQAMDVEAEVRRLKATLIKH